MSHFESKRLRNIEENRSFLGSLNIRATTGINGTRKRKVSDQKKDSIKRARPQPSPRFSLRLRNREPGGEEKKEMKEDSLDVTASLVTQTVSQPGSITFSDCRYENYVELDEKFESILTSGSNKLFPRDGLTEHVTSENSMIKSYSKLSLKEQNVCRMLPRRMMSLAVHPASVDSFLIAAGDINGCVALLHSAENGIETDPIVSVYRPHYEGVPHLKFTRDKLYMCSYEGSLRCADLNKLVFDEVYRDENEGFSYFDFLDDNVLAVSTHDGDVKVIDLRKPSSPSLTFSASNSSLRTVSVSNSLVVTAGREGVMRVFDVRKFSKTQKIFEYVNNSAFYSAKFSALGTYIYASTRNDLIHIWKKSNPFDLVKTVKHLNFVNRYVAPFKVNPNPYVDSVFSICYAGYPRQIQFLNSSATVIYSCKSEFLQSLCPFVAFHPSMSLLVGGNTNGRVHIFTV